MTRRNGGLHTLIIGIHVLFAGSVFHRPHLPEIIPSYQRFDDVLPWVAWGYAALLIAGWMYLSRPGTLAGQAGHFLSASWFFLVAAVFGGANGVTSAVTTYTALALGSIALFGNEYALWLPKTRLMRAVIARQRGGDGP